MVMEAKNKSESALKIVQYIHEQTLCFQLNGNNTKVSPKTSPHLNTSTSHTHPHIGFLSARQVVYF